MSICLCVQLKGGPHVGHLLQSTQSRHTFNLHINEQVQQCSIHCNVYMIMHRDMYMIHIYVTQVKYTINDHTIFQI